MVEVDKVIEDDKMMEVDKMLQVDKMMDKILEFVEQHLQVREMVLMVD